jgi:hypothetical protein
MMGSWLNLNRQVLVIKCNYENRFRQTVCILQNVRADERAVLKSVSDPEEQAYVVAMPQLVLSL